MNEQDFESGPIGTWFEIKKDGRDAYCLKRADAYAFVYSNVKIYGEIKEWQSDTYRLLNGIRIEGRSFKGPDLTAIQENIDKEMTYLLTITVPYRKI